MYKSAIYIFFCCFFTIVYGQKPLSPPLTKNQSIQKVPAFSDQICLITFSNLPDTRMIKQMNDSGIELIRYAGNNTYLAVLPTETRDITSFGVINIKPWQLSDFIPVDNWPDDSNFFYLSYINKFFRDISSICHHLDIYDFNIDTSNQLLTVYTDKASLLQLLHTGIFFHAEIANFQTIPEDARSIAYIRANLLNSNFASGLHLDGTGVTIAIGDDGAIGPHIDFKNRVNQSYVSSINNGQHGDQVAGLIAGAGNLNPNLQGIVPAANIVMTEHFDAVKEVLNLQQHQGVNITCTSLADGCNRGYTTLSMIADAQTDNHPDIMHVFSAGNAGEQNCDYGAGLGWGTITGGVKMAKNGIVVGNTTADDILVPTSSKGPANDGRIKPDLVSNGSDQLTTTPDNTYGWMGGTSAAAPGVAGVVAQLTQAYRQLFNDQDAPTALIKAAMMNTAEDLGNPGPDFSYGWGRVNSKKAYETIKSGNYWSGVIENNGWKNFVINIPSGVSKMKVMLYWHDAPALPISSIALVNDIDMKIITPGGESHLPWILHTEPDPFLLQLPAGKGPDHLNNVEQICIEYPESGSYVINITGYNIPMGLQDYYIVYELEEAGIQLTYPAGGELFKPGEIQRIYWDGNELNDDPIRIEFSNDNGNSWSLVAELTPASTFYDWVIPANISPSKCFIRIQNGNFNSQHQHPFNIMEVPEDLHIVKVCPDHILLRWNQVSEASGYQVYSMGEKYMEPISVTADTFERIEILNPGTEAWFAVQAIGENGIKSRRSLAVRTDGEIFNCIPDRDISVLNVSSPSSGLVRNCTSEPVYVSANIINLGIEYISEFPVYYQLDDLPQVMQYYNAGLPPGVTAPFSFEIPFPQQDIGFHELKIWTNLSGDDVRYNDTLTFVFQVITAEVYQIPYIETFDQFELSSDIINCNATSSLSKGWINEINDIADTHDWKVVDGYSNLTFPNTDQNNNLPTGNYLNLSSGASCPSVNGIMISPCLELYGTDFPYLSFWYLLSGGSQADNLMYVDIYDGNQWFTLNYFAGHTDGWQHALLPLAAFNQKTINIRFRGSPGASGSGISIDNFSIFDSLYTPVAAFYADKMTTCSGEDVYFTDNSYNFPTSWLWSFDPPDVIFTNGTSAVSKNPVVQFLQSGSYTVTLHIENGIGQDSEVRTSFIDIHDGLPLPVIMNFENTQTDWLVTNPDQDIGWSASQVTGSKGEVSVVMYMDNHSYNAAGQQDFVTSPVIDLMSSDNPVLQFDLAYVMFSDQNYDRLQVLLSSDCGNSFENIIFDKQGAELATSPNQNYAWAPRNVVDWTTFQVDLSAYIGKKIILKWVNINGFGNNLYIDNIFIAEKSDFPPVQIDASSINICAGESIIYDHSATTVWNGNTLWYPGTNAIPEISSSLDPILVNYPQSGLYEVVLIHYNDNLHSIDHLMIAVEPMPVAAFEYSVTSDSIFFSNLSTDAAAYQWLFSDGSLSEASNPVLNILDNNIEWARLSVSNECGTDEILVEVTTGDDLLSDSGFNFTLYPNPARETCTIGLPEGIQFENLQIQLRNINGQEMRIPALLYEDQNVHLHLYGLPGGVYQLQITSEISIKCFKLIKQ